MLGIRFRGTYLNALFRLAVAPDGTVDGCAHVADAPDRDLERRACATLTGRPLFTPARDPAGTAVRGAASYRIVMASVASVGVR